MLSDNKKIRQKNSLSMYSVKTLAITLALSIVLTLLVVTVSGIYKSFIQQRTQATKYALLLARSAGLPYGLGVNVSANQVNDILQKSSFISDINLYSFQHKLDLHNNNKSAFVTAFFANSYNVNQPIVYDEAVERNLLNQISSVEKDNIDLEKPLVSGYISIEIDVYKIRTHWLKDNIWLYFSILLGYLILFFWLYYVSRQFIKQVQDLRFTIRDVSEIDKQGYMSLPSVENSAKYTEYADIRYKLIRIVEQYNVLQDKFYNLKVNVNDNLSHDADKIQQNIQSIICNELDDSLQVVNEGVASLGDQYLLDEQKDALAIIRKGSKQLEFVLQQLVYFQKLQTNQISVSKVEFDPLQLIADIIATVQVQGNKKNIDILSDINHMEYRLEGDIDKIQKIIKVLFYNAINFTNEGSVTIESELQHFKESTRWIVTIKDTGIGIEEKYLQRIFDPFFQINDDKLQEAVQGVGVGLTIAKQLAEMLEAKISVHSEVGKGSSFSVVLPLVNKTQIKERQYLQDVSIICCQNSSKQVMNEQLMDYCGAKKLRFYHNIDEALEMSKQEPADVLLIYDDVHRKQAIELIQKVRQAETNHRLLIVWLVNADNYVSSGEMQTLGVDVSLTMPVSYKELALTINRWLR